MFLVESAPVPIFRNLIAACTLWTAAAGIAAAGRIDIGKDCGAPDAAALTLFLPGTARIPLT
ncbi:hypothetical protein HA397_28580, partial [Escherichia coli]|nr:hypothetical protein [Escherichia coli]